MSRLRLIGILAFVIQITHLNCQIPCLNGGVLAIKPSSNIDQICLCNKNYIGARCENYLPSLRSDQKAKYGCELRPCWIGATCEDRDDGFVCHCSANTFGQFCEQSSLSMTNPCDSKPCYNGGTCIQQDVNSYTCACSGSYGGLSCQQNIVGACASNPCLRGGLCLPIGLTDYRCKCPDWTLGKNCETIFNPCTRVNCANNGQCVKKRTLAFECTCGTSFTGLLCDQTKVLTCLTQGCIYGYCGMNTNGQYACTCNTLGYEGAFCEIERCNPTCKNGYCDRDAYGNYFCRCNTNYQGPDCSSVVCFAGSSKVETTNGLVDISLLKQGDLVKTFDIEDQKWKFSKFITYIHKDSKVMAKYVSIRTVFNRTLLISPLHLIASKKKSQSAKDTDFEFIFAQELKVGDTIIAESGFESISEIGEIFGKGAYAPLTESGTVLVDSILASCYANTNWHEAAHFLFKPIIKISSLLNIDRELIGIASSVVDQSGKVEQMPDNVFWYAKLIHKLVPWIPFSSEYVFF